MRRHSILRAFFRALFPPYLFRIFSLFLAIAAPACAPDEPKPGPNEGAVSIDFVVPGGVGNLTTANWQVLQNGNPLVPALQDQIVLGAATSTSAPNFSVFIKAGTGYSISMTATTSSSVACTGLSSTFSITAGGTTAVPLALACGGTGAAPTGGRATVTATVGGADSCPNLSYLDISPTTLKVGDTALLGGMATDPDSGDTLSYLWSAPSGTFTNPTTQAATYKCAGTGAVNVTFTYQDVTTLLNPCGAQSVVTVINCI
jgi:hypothetical protein